MSVTKARIHPPMAGVRTAKSLVYAKNRMRLIRLLSYTTRVAENITMADSLSVSHVHQKMGAVCVLFVTMILGFASKNGFGETNHLFPSK